MGFLLCFRKRIPRKLSVKPSQEDFESFMDKVLDYLSSKTEPVSTEEIAEVTGRPTDIVEIYCDWLAESLKVQGVPMRDGTRRFGWVSVIRNN